MVHICIGLFLNWLVLFLLGIGPCLLLLKSERRLLTALMISPVLGAALTAIVGSFLVVGDLRVSLWAWPWVLLGTTVSIGLVLRYLLAGYTPFDPEDRRLAMTGAVVLFAIAAVLIAPQLAGGERFTTWRGNGADTINYVAGAGYVDNELYSAVATSDAQTLVNRHQSYVRVRNLIQGSRWATFALLGFAARVAEIPIYQFDYTFTALYFLIACGPAYLIALRMGLTARLAALVAVVVCCGFWAQYVLDIRAMANINAIAILITILLLVARIESRDTPAVHWGEHVLLGLIFGALAVIYVELLPMTALGLAMFYAIRVFRKCFPVQRLRGYAVTAGVAVLATLPVARILTRFLVSQLGGINAGKIPDAAWVTAMQNWLYSNPVLGAWGLSPFTSDAFSPHLVAGLLHMLFMVVGTALTLILGWMLLRFLNVRAVEKRVDPALVGSMVAACLLQAAYLLMHQQRWAAGKGLSYGYAVIILAVAGFALDRTLAAASGRRGTLVRGVRICVVAWLVTQCCLSVSRPALANAGKDFPNYIWHHGEYRQHDVNFSAFTDVISRQNHPPVWSSVRNPQCAEMLSFALGWQTSFISLEPTLDMGPLAAPRQSVFHDAEYLITERNHPGPEEFSPAGVVARNSEFVLLKLEQQGAYQPVVVGLTDADLETGEKPLFWLREKPTTVRLVSPAPGYALLRAAFLIGPSAGSREAVNVAIRSTPGTTAQTIPVTRQTSFLRVPVSRGLNEIELKALDAPAKSASNPQPRMVGIFGMRPLLEDPIAGTPKDSLDTAGRVVATIGNLQWFRIGVVPGLQQANIVGTGAKTRIELSSAQNCDVSWAAPIKVDAGMYRVSTIISAKLEGLPTGAAHVSLLGKPKVISIAAGEYKSRSFVGYFQAPAPGLEGYISFGFGGGSMGRGRIVLEDMRIEKVW